MASAIAKAASRNDVYELVRLAYAYPDQAAEIDDALLQVALRLTPRRKAQDLAHMMTLPERAEPWRSAEAAVRQLVSLGAGVQTVVSAATVYSSDSAKMYAIRVLEATGDAEKAAELRSKLRGQGPTSVSASQPAPPRGLGGWLVLPIIVLFAQPLSVLLGFSGHAFPALASQAWPLLPTPGIGSHHTLWAALFVFEIVARLAVLASSVYLLMILFPKKEYFPKLALWYYPVSAVPTVVFYACLLAFGADSFPRYAAHPERISIQGLVGALVGTVLWLLYFKLSKRVRNTFVN